MFGKIKAMWGLTAEAKRQGITMQGRLILYWVSMGLAFIATLMLILNFTGVFSNPAKKLSSTVVVQQQNVSVALSGQMNTLTAHSVSLSETVSQQVQDILLARGKNFEDLNNNQNLIAEVENALYPSIYTTLRVSECNGAFVLLDATTNTSGKNADYSRMGVYLRYSDLNSTDSANQHLVFFRGVSDVARKEKVQMHNRWNLEFDTTQIPGYEDMMNCNVTRLADSCVWSERIHLKDTWEDAIWEYMPIVDSSGKVRGICGVELSDLYFSLSYPIMDSDYGSMVTLLAPQDGNQLVLDNAMLGASSGTRLEPKGILKIKEGKYYNRYSGDNESYIGIHKNLNYSSASGLPLVVVTLIPESSYQSVVAASRNAWMLGFLILLICTLVLAILLSHYFVKPITQSLKSIQYEQLEDSHSGISEIDELLAFVRSKVTEYSTFEQGRLPPNIEQLLDTFRINVDELTSAEKNLFQYYIDGQTLEEAATLSFTSINTMRKHNTNLRRKLGVHSQGELMLYIDIFRRCNRLAEITTGNQLHFR